MFAGVQEGEGKLSDKEIDLAYDWMMATPMSLAGLYYGYKNESELESSALLNKEAAKLFEAAFSYPHTHFSFSETGELSVTQ